MVVKHAEDEISVANMTVGAGYAPNAWSFDVAYAHIFVDDGTVSLDNTLPSPANRGDLYGTFENKVDIISVEASYKF